MVKHLKIKADFFDSKEMIWLQSQVFGTEYVYIYIKLEMMRMQEPNNLFENGAHYLAQQMRMQPVIVEMALQAMEQVGLVEDVGGGLSRLNSPLEVIEE